MKLKYLTIIWKSYIDPFIKRWVHAPFSNRVTRTLLLIGGAIVATPLLWHLLLKELLNKQFGWDVPADVPEMKAYIAGGFVLVLAVINNIAFLYDERHKEETRQRAMVDSPEIEHDREIIEQIYGNLPYERTRAAIENAPHSGMRMEVAHDFDACEKYVDTPYRLYNQSVEEAKIKLIGAIKQYNSKCSDFLGVQENPRGKMLLPPYHWKSGAAGQESIDRYYSMLGDLAEEGLGMFAVYDEFITAVKQQGFPIRPI